MHGELRCGQDCRTSLGIHSPCVLLVLDIQALLSSLTGISERRGHGLVEGSFVIDRKWKKDSFQEATNDLISPPSGTTKPLRCPPMKRPWC